MSSPEEELRQIFGYDPSKEQPDKGIFEQALEQHRQERATKLVGKCKDLFVQAEQLHNKILATRKSFQDNEKGQLKELTKLVGRIRAMSTGQPPPAEETKEPATT